MRIARCSCLIMLLAVGALGCFSAPKKKSPAAQPTSQNTSPTNNVPFWKQTDPKSPGAPLSIPGPGADSGVRPTAAEQTSYSGVLAGMLVDAFGQRVSRAYIQVAPADSGAGKPIEVAVYDGFFTIPGLTPGRPYMLTARTSGDGERKLAGRLQATPPQPRLVIKMSEELYSPSIPAAPSHAGDTVPNRGTGGIKGDSPLDSNPPIPPLPDGPIPERARGDDGWRQNNNPEPAPGGGSGLSAPGNPPPPPLDEPRIPPTPSFNPENIADRDRDPRRPPAPLINLPGSGSNPGSLPDPDPPPSGSGGPGAFRFSDTPRVPSCEISGRRLVNFALNDLSGRPWEFTQHHGRLVLLDFWGTWCMPCMRAIPHLKKLQSDYGPYGLEVVGIACERTAEPQRTRKVRDVVDRQQINYRVVLGENYEECPVQQKFRIASYPTLILLDGSGNILWRGDATGLNQLEQTIQQQLRVGK